MLRVWATPRSSPERIGRLAGGQIRAYVSPPPERGKANAHLIALLAKLLRVPRDAIEIISGTSHHRKLVRVAGCSEAEIHERIPPLPSGALHGQEPGTSADTGWRGENAGESEGVRRAVRADEDGSPAGLRPAVPTGGPRSLACGTVGPGGGCAERGTIYVNGDASPAGLRPAVPTRGRRSLACGTVGPGGGCGANSLG